MPTVTIAAKTEAEKKLRVRILLSLMIVQHDPHHRGVTAFAGRVGVSRQYIWNCLDAGRCPAALARKLQKIFGPAAAPIEELCWSKIDN